VSSPPSFSATAIYICNRKFELLSTIFENLRIKTAVWDDTTAVLLYNTWSHLKYALPNGSVGEVPTHKTSGAGHNPVTVTHALRSARSRLEHTVASSWYKQQKHKLSIALLERSSPQAGKHANQQNTSHAGAWVRPKISLHSGAPQLAAFPFATVDLFFRSDTGIITTIELPQYLARAVGPVLFTIDRQATIQTNPIETFEFAFKNALRLKQARNSPPPPPLPPSPPAVILAAMKVKKQLRMQWWPNERGELERRREGQECGLALGLSREGRRGS